jgi:hypothetical protein
MEKHAEIGAGRKRRTRTFINGSAKIKLEDYFQKEPRPSPEALDKLADSVKMNYKVLRIWFCNRRQKEKRMKQPTAVPVIKTQLSSQNLADRDESAEAGKADEDVTDDSLTEDTESSFLQSSTSGNRLISFELNIKKCDKLNLKIKQPNYLYLFSF